ncbi:hypothetical protein ABLV49_24095 (plasmid) [Polaromonas hydrogenivorans]|uniref:Uncharacterized protein n=2 Tax=Polaromonas hydrogenivorans TaxID=335476 RepID=A0AAU7M1N1_9BURK
MIFKSHPVAFTQGTHFASSGNALLLKQLLACAAPDFEFPDFDENSMVGVSDARWCERPVAFVVSTLLAP